GQHNAESSSLAGGFILSDNPYGDLQPKTFGADPLYVPQLAVGRLVETPTEMKSALDQYMNTNGVRSPNASYNAAYDWMTSTGQAVDSALNPRVPAGKATSNFSDTWTKTDAKNAIAANAHGFISINAHSNSSQSLPA